MKLLIKIVIVYLIIAIPCEAQINVRSNHIGVSGLPVFDILNIFPENQIKGGAINVNYGT